MFFKKGKKRLDFFKKENTMKSELLTFLFMKKSSLVSLFILSLLLFSPITLGAVVNTDWIEGGQNTPPSNMIPELSSPKQEGDIHQTNEFNAVIKTLRGLNNDAGNIGIGTVAPQTKLHVAGEATIKSLQGCGDTQTVKADENGKLICATDETGGGEGSDGVLQGATLNGTTLSLSISNGSTVEADLSSLGGDNFIDVTYNETTNELTFTTENGDTVTVDITQIFEMNDKYIVDGRAEGNNLILVLSDESEITLTDVLNGGGGTGLWSEFNGNVYRSDGNVGINTQTPERKLHIKEETKRTPQILLEDSIGKIGIWGGADFHVKKDRTLLFVSGDDSFGDKGYVGIGFDDVTRPKHMLHVAGNIKSEGIICDKNGCIGDGGGQDTDWIESNGNVYREEGKVGVGLPSSQTLPAMITVLPPSSNDTPLLQVGTGSSASGPESVALGNKTLAQGGGATAIGDHAKATDTNAMAFGKGAQAIAPGSNALGKDVTASGLDSTAIGNLSTSEGLASTSIGHKTKATGERSFAAGSETTASGVASTTLGNKTEATKPGSTAMGDHSKATGTTATAFGLRSLASGDVSVAMGEDSEAAGRSSMVLGSFAYAGGTHAKAIGYGVQSRGEGTYTFGHKVETGSGVNNAMTVGIAGVDDSTAPLVNSKANSLLLGAQKGNRTASILLDGNTGNIAFNGDVDPNADFAIGNQNTEGDFIARGYVPEIAIKNLGGSQSNKSASLQFTANSKDWNIALDGNDSNKLKFDFHWDIGQNTKMTLESDGVLRAYGGYKSADGTQGMTKTINLTGSDGNACTMTVKNGLITATTCP